jgi:hypothetical protein
MGDSSDVTCDGGSSNASSHGYSGNAVSWSAGSTTPRTFSGLSSSPASSCSSGDFEIGSSQLTVGSGGQVSGEGTIAGTIIDNGLIISGAAPSTYVGGTGGLLDITGTVTGTGALEVGAGQIGSYFHGFVVDPATFSTLELGAPTNNDVMFGDSIGALMLDNPTTFTGKITPAGFGDQIILGGLSLSSLTSYSYTGDMAGGTLVLNANGQVIPLHLIGTYDSGSFNFSAGPQSLSTLPPSLEITVTSSATINLPPYNPSVTAPPEPGHGIIALPGSGAQYLETPTGDGSTFTITNKATGAVALYSTHDDNYITFANGQALIVAIADDANIARLYSAALGRAPDQWGLDGWENSYSKNISSFAKSQGVYVALGETNDGDGTSVAGGFTQSVEFKQLYGSLNDTQFVTQLYQNVLGRGPDQTGLDGWLNAMHSDGYTRDMVLVGFAESAENIANSAHWLITA